MSRRRVLIPTRPFNTPSAAAEPRTRERMCVPRDIMSMPRMVCWACTSLDRGSWRCSVRGAGQ
eukprot:814767-Prymnesium_polylepis.1